MIMTAAQANLDVRRRTRPKAKDLASKVVDIQSDNGQPRTKLPSLYDESVDLTKPLSDGLRDAMHCARVLNVNNNKSGLPGTLMFQPSCYDLDDIDPQMLNVMRLEMMQTHGKQAFQSSEAVTVTQITQRIQRQSAQKTLDYTSRSHAAGGHATGNRGAEHASKSSTCHWCRQAKKWCGWCKRPNILANPRNGPYSSEGLHNHERNPSKADAGVLDFLGIGVKSVRGAFKIARVPSSNIAKPKTTHSKGNCTGHNPAHRSASSLARLEGHTEVSPPSMLKKRTHKLAQQTKEKEIAEREVQRKKVLTVLLEKKPVSFGLFDEHDLEELSYCVQVRQLEPGESVMHYHDDCTSRLVALPDTEDGQPVMAMGSVFFIVMNGMLDVLSEYSTMGPPVRQGKITRGCVFGEVPFNLFRDVWRRRAFARRRRAPHGGRRLNIGEAHRMEAAVRHQGRSKYVREKLGYLL